MPDGERILTWTQLYTLDQVPEHLIVVGSAVTERRGPLRLDPIAAARSDHPDLGPRGSECCVPVTDC